MYSDKRLIIGCPIRTREWIVEPWLRYALVSVLKTDIQFSFMFLIDENDPIQDKINDMLVEYEIPGYFDTFPSYQGVDAEIEHSWSPEKVQYMVDLRNGLLESVRKMAPDYFLSLDSDILAHQDLIGNLLESSVKFDAVGGKTYLSKQSRLPSYAMVNSYSNNLVRTDDIDYVCPVDVIMAIKLMNGSAYGIDYGYDNRGEDIGWSENVKKAGLKIGYDARVVSKHIMEKSQLYSIDPRVGY